jgi:hypothetical protein
MFKIIHMSLLGGGTISISGTVKQTDRPADRQIGRAIILGMFHHLLHVYRSLWIGTFENV